MDLFQKISAKIQNYHRRINIIFPEGGNKLIQEVAAKLLKVNVNPILVFPATSVIDDFVKHSAIETRVIQDDPELPLLGQYLAEIRKNKNDLATCQMWISQANYYSATLLKQGHQVDAMIGGITYPTSDILRPALQVIGPKKGLQTVSSIYYMFCEEKAFIFSDCALNVNPSFEQLTDIAKSAYEASHIFEITNPNMAFLSYSTGTSGAGASVVKVTKAVAHLTAQQWAKCPFEGPIQFDAAINKQVRTKKLPASKLTSNANIMIFPNIDAGNIGYKLVQRLGGFHAVGPIIMGLDKPVNDLSRGAKLDDIFRTALVSAYNVILKEQKAI